MVTQRRKRRTPEQIQRARQRLNNQRRQLKRLGADQSARQLAKISNIPVKTARKIVRGEVRHQRRITNLREGGLTSREAKQLEILRTQRRKRIKATFKNDATKVRGFLRRRRR